MKILLSLTFILIGYFIYGFYLSQYSFEVVDPGLNQDTLNTVYDYRGVINVHSNRGQGSSSPNKIIEDAKKTDLDFLIITDNNPAIQTEQSSLNSYYSNLLVVDAAEYSFLDSRILYVSDHSLGTSSETQLQLTDLLSQQNSQDRDSLLILAHPFQNGPTWTGAFPSGLDGIEILNAKAIASQAWRRSPLDVLWSFVIYPFNSRYAFLRLFREPTDELALWDQLSQERKLLGFAGANASARAIPLANYLIRFPSYQSSFQVIQNHVLLDSELTGLYAKDRSKILSALKNGQFYISLDLLGNPKGFTAKILSEDKQYMMGSTLIFKKDMRFTAQLAREPKYYYEVVLLHNGERLKTTNSQYLESEIKQPGVYRVIVRVSPKLPLPDGTKWFTWIYSNPFYVIESNKK